MKRNTQRDGDSKTVAGGGNTAEGGRRIRILVADDNDFMRHCVRLVLTREGCEVVATAADGEELVACAALHPHDLIVTDIHMPRMNGLQATREILRRHAGSRVILLTSDDDYETARTGFEMGAMGYVVKDGMTSDLRDAVEAVLAGKVFLSGCVLRYAYAPGHATPAERAATTVDFNAL
jgi:DNA-binding NarL/FixJ family response regulator